MKQKKMKIQNKIYCNFCKKEIVIGAGHICPKRDEYLKMKEEKRKKTANKYYSENKKTILKRIREKRKKKMEMQNHSEAKNGIGVASY